MSGREPQRRPAMALENLSLTLGGFSLRRVELSLAAGEIGVILGPNGAGKSVMLETIAGFHRPDAGRVVIGGRDVTALPPEHRHVAFILQNFGLFPHLTVAENVAFGMQARRAKRRASDIQPLLARFRLERVAGQYPATLSPGEKQRTALARGLMTDPDVFLLDEPFAAIDTRTSDSLRDELRRFIRDARVPALFVTHDHLDAAALADKIAVMADGAIVQIGAPAEVFDRPRTRFVAEFLGVENILPGTIVGRPAGEVELDIAGQRLTAPAECRSSPLGGRVLVCIRADAVEVHGRGEDPGPPSPRAQPLSGTVIALANAGSLVRATLDCGFPLTAHMLRRTVDARRLQPGRAIVAQIEPTAVHLIQEG